MNPKAAETPTTSEDTRVGEALDEYLELLKQGRRPAREHFLARHAEIREELSECIDGLEFVEAAAVSLSGNAPRPPAEEMPAELTRLGDFQLIREVGRGGMGIVYEASQVSLGRRVALKVLPFASSIDGRHRRRFQVEAQAAAQLQHVNIVPIHAVGVDRGIHYYAMRFIEGRTLAALIREMRRPGRSFAEALSSRTSDLGTEPTGPFPVRVEDPANASPQPSGRGREYYRTVAELGRQTAEALDHAHCLGVLHRDVKPANLMVDSTGHLWVTDFGLARMSDDVGVTRTGDIIGTLRYMSPEQALGRDVVIDERTDVYSLGVTLYELLTLRPAFDAEDRHALLNQVANADPIPPTRFDRAVPRDLETIILKAMAKDPLSRYRNAAALADDLRRFLRDEPILARRPSPVEKAIKWSRRHRTPLASALVVLMLGLPVATTLLWLEKGQTEAALEVAKQARRNERELLRLTYDMSDEMTSRAMSMVSALNLSNPGGRQSSGFYLKALEFYEKMVSLTRNDPNMRSIRAQALRQAGFARLMLRRSSAEQAFLEAIAIHEDLNRELPDDYSTLEQFARTLETYSLCVRSNRGVEEAYPIHRRVFDLRRRAVSAHPEDPNYLVGLATSMLDWARILAATGRMAESERVYSDLEAEFRALSCDQAGVAESRARLGASILGLTLQLLEQERRSEAIRLVRLGLVLAPNHPYLLNTYAWSLVSRTTPECPNARQATFVPAVGVGISSAIPPVPGDALEALGAVDASIEFEPGKWEFIHTRGVVLYRLGRYREAIQTLAEVMRDRDGGDPFEWLFLAMSHAMLGNRSEALAWYDRSINWITRSNSFDLEIRAFLIEAEDVLDLNRKGVPTSADARSGRSYGIPLEPWMDSRSGRAN